MATKRRKRRTRRRSCKYGKLKKPVRTKKGRKRRCKKSNRKTNRKKQRKKQRKSFRMEWKRYGQFLKTKKEREMRERSSRERRKKDLTKIKKDLTKRRTQQLRIKRKRTPPKFLSVRKTRGELWAAHDRPPSVAFEFKYTTPEGIKRHYDPHGVNAPLKQGGTARKDAALNTDEYENINVDNDITYVIFSHGGPDPSGKEEILPPNIKVYSPLKCMSSLYMPQAEYSIENSCPGLVNFDEKYVLTYYEHISDIIFAPQDFPGELATSENFKTGVYRCTGLNSYDPTPVITIDKIMSLSQIIDELIKMNGYKQNINIILLSCLSLGQNIEEQETVINFLEQIRANLSQQKSESARKNLQLLKDNHNIFIYDRVIIKGLSTKPQYNGQVGYITDFDFDKKRYAVKLVHIPEKKLSIKEQNLERIEEF